MHMPNRWIAGGHVVFSIVDVVQDIRAMNSQAVHATPRKTGRFILGPDKAISWGKIVMVLTPLRYFVMQLLLFLFWSQKLLHLGQGAPPMTISRCSQQYINDTYMLYGSG
ncbi:hypothetical protein QQ045_019216 [Rhodiola kirilowii]